MLVVILHLIINEALLVLQKNKAHLITTQFSNTFYNITAKVCLAYAWTPLIIGFLSHPKASSSIFQELWLLIESILVCFYSIDTFWGSPNVTYCHCVRDPALNKLHKYLCLHGTYFLVEKTDIKEKYVKYLVQVGRNVIYREKPNKRGY